MSQTGQQRQGADEAKAHRHWETFWRIIAGLMVIIIGWIGWVLYQISPRSVVTPLAYESQVKPIRTPPQAAAPGVQEGAGASASHEPAPDTAAHAMDEAQAAMRAGAHQASADVQAAALPKAGGAVVGERLKLSTEITTPLAERIPKKNQEGNPDAADAAAKARP